MLDGVERSLFPQEALSRMEPFSARFRWRACVPFILGGLLCGVSPSGALNYNPFPSTRYLTLSSPIAPTSEEECAALSAESAEETSALSAQHDQCTAADPKNGFKPGRSDSIGGSCSSSQCQALHTAMHEARSKGNEEVRICRGRLRDYLAEKRRDEERDRVRKERADRKATDKRTERDRETSEKKAEEDRQAEKDRDDEAARDRLERAEQDRQQEEARRQEETRRQAEARRQAYLRAVANTASNLKSTWQQRIRSGVPEVISDTSSFMQIVNEMFRGNGSRSLAEVIVAADTLAERAEKAYSWITSPLQTFSDQVTADAIELVKAQGDYQGNDARVHTIFRGVQKLNDITHESNPFAKSMNAAVYGQLESHFQSMLGEVENLEHTIGAFDYSSKKYADQPLANPFRGSTATLPKSSPGGGNPWGSNPGSPTEAEAIQPAPPADQSAATGNPFRSSSDVSVPSPTASLPALSSTNPFRSARTTPGNVTTPSRLPETTTSVHPTPGGPTDRMILYRDPTTRQLSERPLSSLPDSMSGDALDQPHCSPDGLGIVTEACERRRHADQAQDGQTVK